MGKDALEFYIQNFGETTIWIKDPDQGVSEEKRNSLQTQPGHEWKYDINGSHEYYSCVTKTVYMTDFKNMPMEIEALKDTYYYNVTVKYNEDAIFKIFEVDPDAEYTNFHDSDEDSEDEVATSDSNSKDIYTNRDYFNESKETISDLVEETKFIKSVMATSAIKAEEVRELLKLTQSNAPVSNNRYEFVKNALTLIGVVPYNSQGYPVTGGWNEENGWWNYTNMDSYGRPGGLCSAGFVQWALMTTGYNDYGIIISPYVLEQAVAFGNNTLQIVNNPDDIKPGDIAVETGNLQNIVSKDIGIYVGQKDGVQYYVYINAEKNTVVCDAHEGSFNKFYRLSSIDGSDWQDFSHDAIPEYQPNINNERTDDVFAIARTLQEYATEGLDARLGIGLVITNRYDNTNFPNDYVAVCKGLTQTNTSYIPSSTNIMMALRIYERDNNERYSALFDGIDTKNVLYYRCVKDQAASKRKDDYNGHTFVKLINHMAFYR